LRLPAFPHPHQLSVDSNSVFLVVIADVHVASLRKNFMESINFYTSHTRPSSTTVPLPDPSAGTEMSDEAKHKNLSIAGYNIPQ
jgi:hypothetical protein